MGNVTGSGSGFGSGIGSGFGEGLRPGVGAGVSTTGVESKLDQIKGRPAEGPVTSRVEYQTAKVPSLIFLAAAGASVIGSVFLFAFKKPLTAIFVGLWPPTFLLLGNYNKMVKLVNELTPTTGSKGYGSTY